MRGPVSWVPASAGMTLEFDERSKLWFNGMRTRADPATGFVNCAKGRMMGEITHRLSAEMAVS